jgi:hypothetical protein
MSDFSWWQWIVVVALLYLFIHPLVGGFRTGFKAENSSKPLRDGARTLVTEVVDGSNVRPMVIKSAWIVTRWQLFALVVLSLWPIVISLLFPSKPMVSILPVVLFAPIGWMVGVIFALPFGGSEFVYQIGFSIGVFLIAYLCLVNWRYVRAKKRLV